MNLYPKNIIISIYRNKLKKKKTQIKNYIPNSYVGFKI